MSLLALRQPAQLSPKLQPVALESEPVSDLLVDFSRLEALVNHDPEKFKRFALLFVRSTTETMDQAELAQSEQDVPKLSELAHRMKSSARTIGANSFADVCQQLEQLKRMDDLPTTKPLVQELKKLFGQIQLQFARKLDSEFSGHSDEATGSMK